MIFTYTNQRSYDIGDTVTWTLNGGQQVTGRVIGIDVRDGQPIFDGDNGHWGYDDQIVAVRKGS